MNFGGILTTKVSFIFSDLVFKQVQYIMYQETVAFTLRLINIWVRFFFLSSRRKIVSMLLLEDMGYSKDGQGATILSVSAQEIKSSEKLSD